MGGPADKRYDPLGVGGTTTLDSRCAVAIYNEQPRGLRRRTENQVFAFDPPRAKMTR